MNQMKTLKLKATITNNKLEGLDRRIEMTEESVSLKIHQ